MTTHNKASRLLSVLLMAAALCASAIGAPTALTQTTLSVAIPAAPQTNQQVVTSITVASATGMVANGLPSNQGGIGGPASGTTSTYLYIDRELMRINSISGTVISVGRGVQGTPATAHLSGAAVYVATGRQLVQSAASVTGSCVSATQPPVYPYIDPATGLEYGCPAVGPYANQWTTVGMTSPYGSFTPSDNTLPGTSVSFVCHGRYSFAVDGGAVSTIALGAASGGVGCTIPINAVIYKVLVDCVATTVGSTGNISIGLSAGGAGAAALFGATARASCSAGTIFDGVPIEGTASASNATYIKTSAAGSVTFTISTNALTAGIVDADVFYYILQA